MMVGFEDISHVRFRGARICNFVTYIYRISINSTICRNLWFCSVVCLCRLVLIPTSQKVQSTILCKSDSFGFGSKFLRIQSRYDTSFTGK